MRSVTLVGESGVITEIVEIGPAFLVRHRTWANLRPLLEACRAAGFDAAELSPTSAPQGAAPSVWLLSDMPFLAAEASGLLAALSLQVPSSAGLVMIGGAYSYAGLQGVGGWQDPRGAALLPVEPGPGADAIEAPQGVRIVPEPGCPAALAAALRDAPPFFGYNHLRPRPGAEVLARFDDGAVALAAGPAASRRSVAFASDLLPHWAPAHAAWAGLPALLHGLCHLAAPER